MCPLIDDLKVGPIRDVGLLDSALHRPQATVFGVDAYTEIDQKAAVLLESLVRNDALIDGNKRIGWLVHVRVLRAQQHRAGRTRRRRLRPSHRNREWRYRVRRSSGAAGEMALTGRLREFASTSSSSMLLMSNRNLLKTPRDRLSRDHLALDATK